MEIMCDIYVDLIFKITHFPNANTNLDKIGVQN